MGDTKSRGDGGGAAHTHTGEAWALPFCAWCLHSSGDMRGSGRGLIWPELAPMWDP